MTAHKNDLKQIVMEYRLSGGKWPASAQAIAGWAIGTRRWQPRPSAQINQCARELSRAMREEYITDRKGRRVRVKHPVVQQNGDTQVVLWDDIRTASRVHMEMSFAQRRNRIVGDCRQLKMDADSYNDAHPNDEPIQLVFDFTFDLAELEAAAAAA
jgi:hypothetical protein